MSRNKYLVDTNICITVLRGKHNAGEIFEKIRVNECYLSELTVYELLCGNAIAKAKKVGYREEPLSEFISMFDVLPIAGCLEFAASEKGRLQIDGTPLDDDFDLLIGATSVKYGMIMVTDNTRHFKNIQGIQLEDWLRR